MIPLPQKRRPLGPIFFLAAATVALAAAAASGAPVLVIALAALLWVIALVALLFASARPRRVWSFEASLAATSSGDAVRRRQAAAELEAHSDEMSAEQSERAAARGVELTGDGDPQVRWQATRLLAGVAGKVAGATRTTAFACAMQRASDAYPPARGAAAMAIAANAGGEGGPRAALARAHLEKLLDDEEGMVRLWALDGIALVSPRLEEDDRAALAERVLKNVTSADPSTAWKSGRTLVAMAAAASPKFGERVVVALVAAAGTQSGDAPVIMVDLSAELRSSLTAEVASAAVARLVALAEAHEGELALRALRAACVFAAAAPINVDNDGTQGLARMATGTDALRRDAALLCLGAIGAWAGPFGVEVQAGTARDVARNLTELFKSNDATIRRFARDLWPVAWKAVAPAERDALIRGLLEAHAEPAKNVRAAAVATLTAIRNDFTAAQSAAVVRALVALMRHPDGDTKRHATVTAVEIYDVLDEGLRGAVMDGLGAMTHDPDAVVADQAHDSIRAIGEYRMRSAQAEAH